MVNYAVNDFTESASTLAGCLALLETKLESIDEGKAIKLIEIHKVGNQFAYALVTIA